MTISDLHTYTKEFFPHDLIYCLGEGKFWLLTIPCHVLRWPCWRSSVWTMILYYDPTWSKWWSLCPRFCYHLSSGRQHWQGTAKSLAALYREDNWSVDPCWSSMLGVFCCPASIDRSVHGDSLCFVASRCKILLAIFVWGVSVIGDVFKCASQHVLLQQKYYFEIYFSCNWIFFRFRGVVLMQACPVSIWGVV